jgi:hypothetical protein
MSRGGVRRDGLVTHSAGSLENQIELRRFGRSLFQATASAITGQKWLQKDGRRKQDRYSEIAIIPAMLLQSGKEGACSYSACE